MDMRKKIGMAAVADVTAVVAISKKVVRSKEEKW
jgi:hypothetical protein